jgi:hypothetical protein
MNPRNEYSKSGVLYPCRSVHYTVAAAGRCPREPIKSSGCPWRLSRLEPRSRCDGKMVVTIVVVGCRMLKRVEECRVDGASMKENFRS